MAYINGLLWLLYDNRLADQNVKRKPKWKIALVIKGEIMVDWTRVICGSSEKW